MVDNYAEVANHMFSTGLLGTGTLLKVSIAIAREVRGLMPQANETILFRAFEHEAQFKTVGAFCDLVRPRAKCRSLLFASAFCALSLFRLSSNRQPPTRCCFACLRCGPNLSFLVPPPPPNLSRHSRPSSGARCGSQPSPRPAGLPPRGREGAPTQPHASRW